MEEKKDKKLLVRLKEEELQQLQMMSKSEFMSMNNYIRKLIQKEWKRQITGVKEKIK